MLNFKDYIIESSNKTAVMSFGRMSPPTVGHMKVIDKVKSIAKKVGGSAHVIVSHSHDSNKNPLTAEQKIKHLKRYAPDVHVSASDKEHPSIFHQAAKLHKAGVEHLHVVAGSDRVDEYKEKLNKYNHKDGPFHFKSIHVHSAGQRDPDAEGDTGMSGTKMRHHASNNDFKSFRKGVPAHVSDEHAKELMHDVQNGMKKGLKEDFEPMNIDFE